MWRMVIASLLVLGSLLVGNPTQAKTNKQLLFEVKTNHDANKLYRFTALTKGKTHRFVALLYERMTLTKTPAGTKRYKMDLCFPLKLDLKALGRGFTILRSKKGPQPPANLRKLLAQKPSGQGWTATQTQQYKSFCRGFLSHQKGRSVNAFRGYGFKPGQGLHPLQGGYIVVTYLNNALLNFFRGKYRYFVLKLQRKPHTQGDQKTFRWALSTRKNKRVQKLFYRTYRLGVDKVEIGWKKHSKTPILPAKECTNWIDAALGTCRLTSGQRASLAFASSG